MRRSRRTTQVILLEDIYKTGVAGDVVDVAPGFARNYLIPQGMAVRASKGTMSQMETLRRQAEVRRAERKQQYEVIAEQIAGLELIYPVRASETGKLYGSVTTQQIAESIQEELGYEIDHRRVGDRPLRELGRFEVPVRLDANLSSNVVVIVHREGEDPYAVEEEMDEREEGLDEMAEGVFDEAEDVIAEVESVVETVEGEAAETVDEAVEDKE